MVDIKITGRKVSITDGMREHVTDKVGGALKVFDISPMSCDVVLRVGRNRSNPDRKTCEITVFVRDAVVRVEASQEDMYVAIDEAAEKVEGVAHVGGNDIASSLVSVFTNRSLPQDEAVEAYVEDGQLRIVVHVAVFYGYPFTRLAAVVREAVARAIREQVGVDVDVVDVCIDGLVFPKE